MATTEQDLPAILEERRHFAERTVDEFGARRETYEDWHDRREILDHLAANEWDVVWPDNVRERALPKIPNWIVLAAKHRSRLLAETMPTVTRRPRNGKEATKAAAEKVERILSGFWQMSRLPLSVPMWGFDLQFGGLSAVKVLPDFSKPKSERFPVYTRMDPRTVYPSPMFAQGPYLDDCVISYEEYLPVIAKRFGAELDGLMRRAPQAGQVRMDKARVIEFYDTQRCLVIVEAMYKTSIGQRRKPFEVVLDESFDMGKCPVAIGVVPTHDGIYRGDFDAMVAMLNTNNRLMTLHLDSAVSKVYPTAMEYEIENWQDEGPGAMLHKLGPASTFEYIQTPASAYDNYNMLRMMDNNLRTEALLPQSVTGNPDESVISAAGIAATQSMPNAEVVSLQRDSLAPMLQAANELALCADQRWADTEKTITGVQRGAPFAETYTPSKDIDGDYSNEVIYGIGSGLDKVNTGIMVKQDLGAGLISKQTAMEKNPFIDDPQREKLQILKEMFQEVGVASILTATQLPPGTPGRMEPDQVFAIFEDIDAGMTMVEAYKKHQAQIALVQPPSAMPQGGALASPGIAGAGEPQPPTFSGPPVDQLTG